MGSVLARASFRGFYFPFGFLGFFGLGKFLARSSNCLMFSCSAWDSISARRRWLNRSYSCAAFSSAASRDTLPAPGSTRRSLNARNPSSFVCQSFRKTCLRRLALILGVVEEHHHDPVQFVDL